MVEQAVEKRGLQTYPMVNRYIVDVLTHFSVTSNLHQETLAEMYLKAMSEESSTVRIDTLKKLGDSSLYISGFFGDSLKRKLVDIDYYVDLGGRAYDHLASEVEEDTSSKVFNEIANKFLDFVDVLTLISQKVMVQTNEDLLRLYDRYLTTGSELAKDQLLEKGLLTNDQMKSAKKQ